MNKEHINQIGEAILHDGDGLCEVISDLRPCPDGESMDFVIHNKETGQKYRVTVRHEEI